MTLLESLPNELLFLIVRHLHQFDILYAFANLNQRLQQIVRSYFSHVNLTDSNFPSYRHFRLFCEHLLPDNAHHIRSLTFADYHQLELFRMYIRQCINLTALTIKNERKNQQNPFLAEALALSSLSELSLTFANDDILRTISASALPSLRRLTLICSNGNQDATDASVMPYLRCLSVNLESVQTLADLCTLMPTLEELNLSIQGFNDLSDTFQLDVPKTLTRLSVEFGCYNEFTSPSLSFKVLQSFLELFRYQLRSLTVIGINVCEKVFSDYDQLQSLVENFTRLENFEYRINTNQEPDAHSRFPHVGCLPDMTYSIYTHPKPQPFDTVSWRVRYSNEPHSTINLRQLFNCRTLELSGQSSIPTSFELKKELLLKNLKKIESHDPVGCCEPQLLQYAAQIIRQAPNLDTIEVWSWSGPSSVLEPCRVMFPRGEGARITHTDISIGSEGMITSVAYSTFLTEVSALFPNTKELRLHVEPEQLNGYYTSFAQLIDDVRRNFKRITRLEVSMWLRDQSTFDSYIQDLIKLNNEQSLHHTVVDRSDENTCYTFLVWL